MDFRFDIRFDNVQIQCTYINYYASAYVTVFDPKGNTINAIANNQIRLPDNVSKRNLALMMKRMFKRSILMFPMKTQADLLKQFESKLTIHIVENGE